ncbi:MAG: hypothetical protein WA672_08730 [Candidatus Angelobacter sp.]
MFARDIAVRKTAAELETVRDFNRVLSLLERCLKSDFDGFEILLNTDIFGQSKEYSPWNRPIKRLWKNGYDGKMVFTSDLSTPTHGLVGTISLHRPIVGGWLMDTDLLAGSLHKSLGIAVENCILGAAKPLFVVRTLETIPNQIIVDPDSQFRIFQEDPLPSGHRLAGASSGND